MLAPKASPEEVPVKPGCTLREPLLVLSVLPGIEARDQLGLELCRRIDCEVKFHVVLRVDGRW
jgi:hypothetical protein